MTEEEWTNRDIDAAVMLRLGARGATSETILLAVDQPTLTPEQLHSSLRRLEQVTGRISWYPDTGRVVAAAILTYFLTGQTDPSWDAPLERAWRAGNAWRGPGLPRFGPPGAAEAMSEAQYRAWAYELARGLRMPGWPPAGDDSGPAPS